MPYAVPSLLQSNAGLFVEEYCADGTSHTPLNLPLTILIGRNNVLFAHTKCFQPMPKDEEVSQTTSYIHRVITGRSLERNAACQQLSAAGGSFPILIANGTLISIGVAE